MITEVGNTYSFPVIAESLRHEKIDAGIISLQDGVCRILDSEKMRRKIQNGSLKVPDLSSTSTMSEFVFNKLTLQIKKIGLNVKRAKMQAYGDVTPFFPIVRINEKLLGDQATKILVHEVVHILEGHLDQYMLLSGQRDWQDVVAEGATFMRCVHLESTQGCNAFLI